MAQFETFYKYHGENGELFKLLIIDSGLWDKKTLYPISEIKNEFLLSLYKSCVIAKRQYLGKLVNIEYYLSCKRNYYKELPKYHKTRN